MSQVAVISTTEEGKVAGDNYASVFYADASLPRRDRARVPEPAEQNLEI